MTTHRIQSKSLLNAGFLVPFLFLSFLLLPGPSLWGADLAKFSTFKKVENSWAYEQGADFFLADQIDAGGKTPVLIRLDCQSGWNGGKSFYIQRVEVFKDEFDLRSLKNQQIEEKLRNSPLRFSRAFELKNTDACFDLRDNCRLEDHAEVEFSELAPQVSSKASKKPKKFYSYKCKQAKSAQVKSLQPKSAH